MSKFYEAAKRAEVEKGNGLKPPLGNGSADGQGALGMHQRTGAVPTSVEYQKIRMWLTAPTPRSQRLQTVMVAACRSGMGSTTTAAMLAATLAEGKKSRVLIIDGNFRTPSLNLVFQVKDNGGLTETVFTGTPFEAHVQPTNRQNLFVLTSGQISLVPAEVFEGEAIDQLITYLKQKFDFIIFDAAPLLEFPDAYALAPKVDTIIMVVEAGKTPVEGAQRAKRDLERAGGQILGVVFNRQKDYTPTLLKKFLGPLY